MEINQIWKRLKIHQRFAIVSTFLFGILAHGPMLFNKLSNRDDLRYIFTGGVTFTSGRWMLFLVEKTKNLLFQDSIYSIPTINGLFSLLCIAVSLCLLIDLFELRSVNNCILLSGIMVSIPVIASLFGYMFVAHYFCLAFFLAVLGSYLILKKTRWYTVLSGIVLMVCSVGLYQAYIPSMLCILLLGLIKRFSEADCKEKRIDAYKLSGIILGSCFALLLLYNTVTEFFLKINGLKLSGYKGIGSAGSVSLQTYFGRALFAYLEFFRPRRGAFYDVLPGGVRALFLISIVLFFILYLYFVCSRVKKNGLWVGLILGVLGLLIPLAVNFIFVMVDETFCNALMVYGYALFFMAFVWIFEQTAAGLKPLFSRILNAGVTLLLGLVVIAWCRYDNVCYMRLEMVQAQYARYFTSLITRMQNTEGYNSSMQVAYIGDPRVAEWDTTMPETSELNYIRTHPFFGIREVLSTDPWRNYMTLWCEFQAWEANPADFAKRPEVLAMPHYPDAGSIKVIGDTLVVRF